jgi:hypothetical protein
MERDTAMAAVSHQPFDGNSKLKTHMRLLSFADSGASSRRHWTDVED